MSYVEILAALDELEIQTCAPEGTDRTDTSPPEAHASAAAAPSVGFVGAPGGVSVEIQPATSHELPLTRTAPAELDDEEEVRL